MVAVISGATKGIGKNLALYFASKGYQLALGARNIELLISLKNEIENNYGVAVFVKSCDFSKKEATIAFANEVLNQYKNVDVLVNNVGIYRLDSITDENENFELLMNTNLRSAYYLSKFIANNMRQQNSGHIFNICSVLSLSVQPQATSYTISKHALKGLNDVLREDLREDNVKVTAIYPGSMNTSSWEGMIAPKELFVQPQDIVDIINTCLTISKNANIEEIVIKPMNKKY
ncbi:MAG: short-chain dehydrogenase [Flavobacteriales bacterium CG_4_10_14_0_2_um_filter_32_8]|nr:MAG: short-chain dehydrogenase [Flavobacteriales bacterium CG_4_10_14_0_2_um_filter_32_8]PJB13955.1 MAG: short-chain dehydrogenase [Flavobacteriales bacterium CG_4_9_14_3_um_filter_32_8]